MNRGSQTILYLAALAAAIALSACDADGGNNPICAPGTTQSCICPGGASGVQTCNSAGSGWDACVCSSPDTSTDTGVPDVAPDTPADVPPECTPDGVWDITITPTSGTCTGATTQSFPITFATSGLSISWTEDSGWIAMGTWTPTSCTATFTQTWTDSETGSHYVWEMVILFTPTSLTASPATMMTVTFPDSTSCTQFYEMIGSKR